MASLSAPSPAQKAPADRDLARKAFSVTSSDEPDIDGLVAGKQNKLIAFDYGISPRTVEIYRANVMTRMEASSLSAPVRMAILGGTARWHELTGRTTRIEPDHGDD